MSTTFLWDGTMVGRGFHCITFSPAAAVTTRGLPSDSAGSWDTRREVPPVTPQLCEAGAGIQVGRPPPVTPG